MTVTPVDPSSDTAAGDPGPEPRLVVPAGLEIDEGVRERLVRLLAAAPLTVAGLVAETGELAPGSSYRVHAEWKSLESSATTSRAPATVAHGAVLLRPHVEFEVRDGAVEITDGTLLVDLGAHVHDPYRPIGPLRAASERGRPPFPRRPVVLFLGCEEEGRGDWARRFANKLVRRDVEARIALPDVASGLHLTRPCLPCEATVRALAPDVIVTVDDAARAQVGPWSAGDRSTVVIDLDPEGAGAAELVSWQIGRASGRVRARIGARVDVPTFAALVGRLCSGPHPMPPSDPPVLAGGRASVHERWTTGARVQARPECVVVTGTLDAPAATRVEGLLDNLAAAGIPVASTTLAGGLPDGPRRAGLVLLAGVAPVPEIEELIAHRRQAGLPTVVDLGRHDVEPDPDAADGAPRLTETAVTLATACGLVVSPAGGVHGAARRLGVRALVLPTLLTRVDASVLRDARTLFDPTATLIVGWHVGSGPAPMPEYGEVVGEAIAKILTDRPDVPVEIVGDRSRVPTSLRGHHRLSIVPEGALDAEALVRWTVHVWTPAEIGGEVVDDLNVFEAASYVGVPSVMAASARGVVDGFVSPHVLVRSADSAEGWVGALQHVLDRVDLRVKRSKDALRRADAVDALAVSKTIVNRFVGWARYQDGHRVGNRHRVDA